MKIKFVGTSRSDGSPTQVLIDGEHIDLAADGTIDVADDAAEGLLDTGNFEEAGKSVKTTAEGAVDKDALIEQAKALGINANKSWGVAKLEEAIAAATPAEDAPKTDDFLG